MRWVAVVVALACGQAFAQPMPGASVSRRSADAGGKHDQLVSTAEGIDASDAVDEMVDDLASDVARLGLQVTPLLVERIRLSDNLNPGFAAALEARIAAAVLHSANITVVRCVECRATRSRVEDGTWVVSRGIAHKSDLEAVAAKYQAKAVLSVSLAMRGDPDTLAMDVEVVRAADSAIVFAESYRFDGDTAMLYRGADRATQRAEKLQDLEDRVAQRPHFGHEAFFGAMRVPSQSADGAILGTYGGYRMYEKFGPEREYRIALQAGAFLDLKRLAGAALTASLWRQVLPANVYSPQLLVGLEAGAFITGSTGNTPMGSVGGELVFGHRIALQALLVYLSPFKLKEGQPEMGGFCPTGGVAFVW